MPDKKKNTLGDRIRKIRLQKGLTQEKLGEMAHLHYSYIGQIERGDKAPSLKALKKIAQVLNANLDFLLEEKADYSLKEDHYLYELQLLLTGRTSQEKLMITQVVHSILTLLDAGNKNRM